MKIKGLISKSLAILGIASGLLFINSQQAHATIIDADYKPELEYQYGQLVDEPTGYNLSIQGSGFSGQPIGESSLNFDADTNGALKITGSAEPIGRYELDLTSSPIDVSTPTEFINLYVHIKANIYLPYEITYVDESGNVLLTESGKEYEDNKWENVQSEFIASATSSNAGKRYRLKAAQSYPETQFKQGTPPQVFVGLDVATSENGSTLKKVKYTLVCEQIGNSGGGNSGGGNSGGGNSGGGSSGGGSSGGGSSGGGSSRIGGSSVLPKTGWIYNEKEDAWYYYSGYTRNTLKKGWHLDPQDKHWYYLDLEDGKMFKGWHLISDKWYFFNPNTPKWTWEQHSDGEWYYKNLENSRPLGSMYANEKTPDGYKVNQDGQYEQ
ncbi:hypothetical protein [Johnsonella ignava]|uniref:hypothetical protein n=1 Tax=Johnsonella ignava TaxID=43995 RepID=UPI000304BC33|nr:hypothetical protein [Johnsonella ignava]